MDGVKDMSKIGSLKRIENELTLARTMAWVQERFIVAKTKFGLDTAVDDSELQRWRERESEIVLARYSAQVFSVEGSRLNAGNVLIEADGRWLPVRLLFSPTIYLSANRTAGECLQALECAIAALVTQPTIGEIEFEAILLYWGRGAGQPELGAAYEARCALTRIAAYASQVRTLVT
jgi:hypothetical protein